MGSKQLQVKTWHLRKMDWDENMGSNKIKKENWHLKKTNGTEKMGSKQLQVKNWHLREMDWDEKTDTWRYTTLEIKKITLLKLLYFCDCVVSGRAFGPLTVQLEMFLPVLLTVKDGRCKQCVPKKQSLSLKRRQAQAARAKKLMS